MCRRERVIAKWFGPRPGARFASILGGLVLAMVREVGWVLLLSTLLAPGASLAAPLNPVATEFNYACTFAGLFPPAIDTRSAGCDIQLAPGAGGIRGEITGGTRPGVVVEGEATTSDPFPRVSASMQGQLNYQVAVEQLRAIPVHVALPVTLDITVAGLVDATTSTSSADAFARIRSAVLVSEDEAHARFGRETDDFFRTYSVAVFPGIVFDVELLAGCFAIATEANPLSRCFALADPLFEFDQVAFDQLAAARGVPSFPLADFYAFQFSPGLVGDSPPAPPGQPVGIPAPATPLLALGGLAAIWLMRAGRTRGARRMARRAARGGAVPTTIRPKDSPDREGGHIPVDGGHTMSQRPVLLTALIAGLALAATPAAAQAPYTGDGPIMVAPNQLSWRDAPSVALGAKIAVIEGPLDKAVPFTVRLVLPANAKIAPHSHPAYERVTVLSGTFHFASGETFDPSKTQALVPGSLAIMPPGTPMFGYTKEETVIQLHGVGPWGLHYLNAADDPRKK